MSGELVDTYVAALQHDLADLPADATRVGVVRKPTPWFHGVVDENRPALGPPASLLESFDEKTEALEARGVCDEGAHNAAWEELDFADRYREHLRSDDAAAALADLADRLDAGEDLALVCFENTDRKRCHRTILRDALAERSDGSTE